MTDNLLPMVASVRFNRLKQLIETIGWGISWLCLVLVCITVIQVIARYVFAHGFVALEELEWHLYATGFLAGLSYCAVADTHIRMDLLHRRFSAKTRSWLELFSMLFLLLPFTCIAFIHSFDFFFDSWKVGERSQAPLGLPYLWFIKGVLPLSLILLGCASLYRIHHSIRIITGGWVDDCQ